MTVERIWAPWRMELIEGEKPEGCIFCSFFEDDDERKNLVLGKTASSFVVLNKYPYNNGHLMVVPAAHASSPLALPREEFLDLQDLLRLSMEVVEDVLKPDAMNVGLNLGRAAGAGIAEHHHWHIVPRWSGDVNFMPVLAETRVMPQHLEDAYERFRPAFERALGGP